MKGFISIPPIPEFREHINAVLMLLNTYHLAVAADVLPDTPKSQQIATIVSVEEIATLKEKFDAVPVEERVPLEEKEAVQLTACYLLLSHLLVAEEGEKLFGLMYEAVPPDEKEETPDFYDFPTLRKRILAINDHLIANSDAQIGEAEGYAEMKTQVAALME